MYMFFLWNSQLTSEVAATLRIVFIVKEESGRAFPRLFFLVNTMYGISLLARSATWQVLLEVDPGACILAGESTREESVDPEILAETRAARVFEDAVLTPNGAMGFEDFRSWYSRYSKNCTKPTFEAFVQTHRPRLFVLETCLLGCDQAVC